MQIFTPYSNPLDCAKALWNDKLRYNKQILEIEQIQRAILGSKNWKHHPITKMYENHYDWLMFYKETFIAYKKFMNSNSKNDAIFNYNQALIWSERADKIMPSFLKNSELLNAHKRRLYAKAAHLYPQFAEFGKSEENWYYVDGKLLKYINGKRIN